MKRKLPLDQASRLGELLALVGDAGQLRISDAATALGVSEATVRRDLDQLARQNMVGRVRGGALSSSTALDLPLRYKAARHAPEKERIAAAAAKLVDPGSTVGLNGGTTTTAVARALAKRAELTDSRPRRPITVITNALNIAHDLTLRPKLKVVVIGGVVRPESYELIGPLATKVLDDVTMDYCILSVDAIDARHGATAHHEGEASINRLMASRAQRLIVVADGSKVGKQAFARIARPAEIALLITDSTAPQDAVDALCDVGCDVDRV